MAFNNTNFSVLGIMDTGSMPSFGQRTLIYTTTDNLSDVDAHYFDSACEKVRSGDHIRVSAADGLRYFYVNTSQSNSVVVIGLN